MRFRWFKGEVEQSPEMLRAFREPLSAEVKEVLERLEELLTRGERVYVMEYDPRTMTVMLPGKGEPSA